MNLATRDDEVRQHGLRAARRRRRARRRSPRPRACSGIRTKLDGIPSEGLGGLRLGVSPLEMSSAYATLAAGGMYSEPKAIKRVEFPDGKSDELGKPKRKRVISDGVAFEVDQDPPDERAARHRHARAVRLPGRRQDGHDRQLQRRVVRRLHAGARRRGVGRLPERAEGDAQRARHPGRGRHLPDADLARLHGPRAQDMPALPAAEAARAIQQRSTAATRRHGQTGPYRAPTYGGGGGGGGGGSAGGGGPPRLRPAPLRRAASAGARGDPAPERWRRRRQRERPWQRRRQQRERPRQRRTANADE